MEKIYKGYTIKRSDLWTNKFHTYNSSGGFEFETLTIESAIDEIKRIYERKAGICRYISIDEFTDAR